MTDNKIKKLKDLYGSETKLSISVYLDKIYQLISESQDEEHPESNESLLLRLNKAYWDLVNAIVHLRVLDNEETGLEFSETEKFFLDYSWIDEALVLPSINGKELPDIVQEDKSNYDVDGKLSILNFTQCLSAFYLDIFQFEKNKQLQFHIANIQKTLLEIPDRIIEVQRARNNLQSASLHAKAMAEYTSQLEKIFPQYYEIKRQINKGMALKPEMRKVFAGLNYAVEQAKNKKSFLLRDVTKVGDSDRIIQLDKEVEKLMIDRIEIKHKANEVEGQVVELNLKQEALYTQASEQSDVIAPMIERMSANAMLCAKRVHRVPCSLRVIDSQPLITKKDILLVLEKLEEFDRTLFTNKDEFYPSFMIIPGVGNAIYDWKEKMILVPNIPVTTVADSVITGVVDYKFTIDEENELEHSYFELHPELKRMGMIRIRETFFKDYSTWILKEATGIMTFKKPEREWFEAEIAPRKNSLRKPRYIRYNIDNLDDIAKLQDLADGMLKEDSNSFDGNLTKGFVHYTREEIDLAKEYFAKAVEADNENPIAIYNLALVLCSLHISAEAETWLKKYITIDKGSFWRNNAQRLAMEIRSQRRG